MFTTKSCWGWVRVAKTLGLNNKILETKMCMTKRVAGRPNDLQVNTIGKLGRCNIHSFQYLYINACGGGGKPQDEIKIWSPNGTSNVFLSCWYVISEEMNYIFYTRFNPDQ